MDTTWGDREGSMYRTRTKHRDIEARRVCQGARGLVIGQCGQCLHGRQRGCESGSLGLAQQRNRRPARRWISLEVCELDTISSTGCMHMAIYKAVNQKVRARRVAPESPVRLNVSREVATYTAAYASIQDANGCLSQRCFANAYDTKVKIQLGAHLWRDNCLLNRR